MFRIYRAGVVLQSKVTGDGKIDNLAYIHTAYASGRELERIYMNAPFLRSQHPNSNKDGETIFFDEEAKAAVMAFNYNERD